MIYKNYYSVEYEISTKGLKTKKNSSVAFAVNADTFEAAKEKAKSMINEDFFPKLVKGSGKMAKKDFLALQKRTNNLFLTCFRY